MKSLADLVVWKERDFLGESLWPFEANLKRKDQERKDRQTSKANQERHLIRGP